MSDTGKYLRVNYRRTGGLVGVGDAASAIVRVRTSLQLDSAANNCQATIPLGFTPVWAIVKPLPDTLERHALVNHVSISATILYVSWNMMCLAVTCELNANLGATYTQVFEVFALVASR